MVKASNGVMVEETKALRHGKAAPHPPTPAAPAAVMVEPETVGIDVPMVKLRGPNGCELYQQRRIDVTLSVAEAATLREVYDGLNAKNTFTKPNPSPADALRWILRRLGERRA